MPTYKVYKRGNYLEVIDTDNNDLWNVRVDHAFIERKKDVIAKYDFFDYSYSRDEKFLGDIQLGWMVDENDAAWELVDFEEFRTCQIGYVPIDYSCGSAAGGGDDGFVVLSGSGDFTVPAGVFNIDVEMWGGGSGASYYTSSPNKIISGGGAGSYIRFKKVVSPGDVLPYTVGAGGNSLSAPQGTNGGNTLFCGRSAAGGLASTLQAGSPNIVSPGRAGNSIIVSGDELIRSVNSETNICNDDQGIANGANAPKGGNSIKFNISSNLYTVTEVNPGNIKGAGGSIRSRDIATSYAYNGSNGEIVIKYNF